MQLIGAGLPRTATLSQKLALETLGLDPTYHMVSVLGDLDEAQRWRAVLDGRPSLAEVFDAYEATVDWPGSFFSAWMSRAMERYNDEVKATVPAERVLVWSPADGWEPLCELLGVPVPDAPFPRVNDSAMFANRIIDNALDVIQEHRSATPQAAVAAR